MKLKESTQLDELKASGDDGEVNDPVTAAGGTNMNRKADKHTGDVGGDTPNAVATPGQDATPSDMLKSVATKKSPARRGDKAIGESVAAIFEGSDLSEEFMEKASVIFEAAVAERIQEEINLLEEEYNTKLEEEIATISATMTENVDTYLDYVVKEWMEENKVAIDRGIRAEVMESFMAGLYDLFVEHNINVPEEEVNVVADMAEELDAKEAALNEQINKTIELTKELEGFKANSILEGYTKGLTETQAEKLRNLAEGIEFADSSEFDHKVKIIKEQYFGGKKVLSESNDNIDPVDVDSDAVVHVDPTMAFYADAISKTIRKS